MTDPQEHPPVPTPGSAQGLNPKVEGGCLLDLVRRRRTWFELTAAYFREIGEEVGAQDDDVLRYGIELMEWNATWFARLEERLSQG